LTIGDSAVATIVIEDLNFAGVSKNDAPAEAVGDGGHTKSAVGLGTGLRCAAGASLDTTSTPSACGGYSMILGDDKTWCFPSLRTGRRCGAVTGPKGREQIEVGRWIAADAAAGPSVTTRPHPQKVRSG